MSPKRFITTLVRYLIVLNRHIPILKRRYR